MANEPSKKEMRENERNGTFEFLVLLRGTEDR